MQGKGLKGGDEGECRGGGEEKSPERSSASPPVPDPWICPSRRDSMGNRYVTRAVHGVLCMSARDCMYSQVYDSTWSHSLHNLDSILRRLTPLALETDRMQTLAQCVPRGDRW